LKRPNGFLACAICLFLVLGTGQDFLRLETGVSAQVPTDADAASTGLSGTLSGLEDFEAVSGIHALSGQASATTGNVVAVEVYFDGHYMPTVLTDANTPAVTYACTLDPAILDAGLHRAEVVVYGDHDSRRRIAGRWFTVSPFTDSTTLDGLASGDVLASNRNITARLVTSTTPVSSVEVRIDGVTRQVLDISPATRRPVVSFTLERSNFPTGRHTMTLVAVDVQGAASIASEASFQVPRGGGALDQPADEALAGKATLSGYVLHGSEVATIEAYLSSATLSETLIWSGAPSRARTETALGADVLATSPKGFAFTLDTGVYPDGAYTLTIKAIPASGTATLVETRTVFIDNANGVLFNVSIGSTANGRAEPYTTSTILVLVPYGAPLDILAAVEGQTVTVGGVIGNLWYKVRYLSTVCYVYSAYVDTRPSLRDNSISSIVFAGLSPYGSGFVFSKTDYSAVVPNNTDRVRIQNLYRHPGTGQPTLIVDGTVISDLYADILLTPGSHVIQLVTPANGNDPGRTYVFRVLRVAEQVGTTTGSPTNLRATAESTGTLVMALAKGVSVIVKATVRGQSTTSGGITTDLWYLVRYPYVENGISKSVEGYIHSPHVTLTDSSGDTAFYLSLAAFPTSYHAALWDIHIRHPLWNLEPLLTGLSWTTVLGAESQAGARRNLTPWYSTKSNDYYSMLSIVTTDGLKMWEEPNSSTSTNVVRSLSKGALVTVKSIATDQSSAPIGLYQVEYSWIDGTGMNQSIIGYVASSSIAADYVPGGPISTYNLAGFHIYDSPNWVAASQKMVAYYLDPRNFLDDRQLFQFEQLSYVPSLHTLSGIEDILSGVRLGNPAINPDTGRPYNTFLYRGVDGSATPVEMTYAQTFLLAGTLSGVSPYHLASKSRMEVSTSAASGMIASALGTLGIGALDPDNVFYACGILPPHDPIQIPVYIVDPMDPTKTRTILDHYITASGHLYAGFFNFYNIGAYPDTTVTYGAMKNGIRYAQWGVDASFETLSAFEKDTLMMPWSDPYRAIVGGAKYLAVNYIGVGQDTMYLEKFDLIGPSYYNHQFVQNVQAARDEGVKYYDAYADIGALNSSFVFRIPVFTDMPATTSPKPQ
jgi:beta-N-acetylglucosaminidase